MAFEIDAEEYTAEATGAEEFDVFEFISNAKLPEHTVAVYTDADAALKIARMIIAENERAAASEDEPLSLDDYEADSYLVDEDELAELNERLVASGLLFHMRGLAPAAVKALEAKIRATTNYVEGTLNEEYNTTFNHTMIAKSIVSVTNADGGVSKTVWSPEKVAKLLESLHGSESAKLFETAAELSYVGAIFDRAVTADFS